MRAPPVYARCTDVRVESGAPLSPLTTFKLGGPADRLVTAEREADVLDVVRSVDAEGGRLLVLGGGSNLVVADEGFPGTVLRMATRGCDVGKGTVTVQAGEVWDDFVTWAVSELLAGVECLAGIPGLVGAVPMQNVGAYGQDVSETIVRLRAYDRQAGDVVTIERADCGFAYRSSVFRGRDRHVILDVTFALAPSEVSRPIRYAELAKALGVGTGTKTEREACAPLETVRRTVALLRQKKGMVLDPSDPDTTSAGSFFTNPILTAAELAALRVRTEGVPSTLPVFPEPDGRSKVSAAWLIEQAGFKKGFSLGRVAVSSKHALALTNRGGASTEELLALARTIRRGVKDRFGVTLENEPVFVGVEL
jgi:UDP-N-acetylmuramate dehydrogenase